MSNQSHEPESPPPPARPSHPVVHVEPLGADLEIRPGETIIEAAWRLGYHWPTVCYGDAMCTVCNIEIIAGDEHLSPIEADEREALEHRLPDARRRDMTRVRLACRARVSGAVSVHKVGVRAPESERS